uniref:Uncharacterized protein n=1 Tax=Rhizophora mucronata TaxID=61149 RepID=A0A2P2QY70_RHIMU
MKFNFRTGREVRWKDLPYNF